MKKTIRKKLSSLVVKTSLTSAIIVGIIAVSALLILRSNTISVSSELGYMAAGDSKAVLEEMSTEQLLQLSQSMSALGDSKLRRVQNSVEMLAYQSGEIVRNPERFMPNPAPPPDASNAGTLAVSFLMAEGVSLADVEEEAALFGNLQDLLYNIFENVFVIESQASDLADSRREYIAASSIGSESGFAIVTNTLSTEGYFDPRERPWYELAVENNGLSWTDVYVDAFGRGLMITCAMPFHDSYGNIVGVASISKELDLLIGIVVGTQVGETGYAFILNEMGQIIISRDIELDEDGSIIRDDWLNSETPELVSAARSMIRGESGIEQVTINGVEYFIAYHPFEFMPWSFVTVVTVDEVIAPALETEDNIIRMSDEALGDINLIITAVIIVFVVALAAIMPIIGYTSRRFSGAITKPIEELTQGVAKISTGNLEQKIEISTGDELETLADSFNTMTTSLREHIERMLEMNAENERVSTELNVATQIQSSMLPGTFPAFPERKEFDIYATMIPAKEVGGDFYDFFLIGEDKLALVMADVSGKGVPAALFMVIAKTLIKNNAQSGISSKEVFETVNNMLCENNEAGMFVTVFMGVLDIPTGKLEYVNAGHNPPLIKRSGGDYEWLPSRHGFVLAGMEGISYKQDEITLSEGDTIFMYTDGVTEAENPSKELFGDPRLLDIANRHKTSGLKDFLDTVKSEVDLFADGAEQADDITMLIMKINESTKIRKLSEEGLNL